MKGIHNSSNFKSGASQSSNGNIVIYEASRSITLSSALDDVEIQPGYIFNNSDAAGYATLMLSDDNSYKDYILAPGPNPLRVKKVTATAAEGKTLIDLTDLKIVY